MKSFIIFFSVFCAVVSKADPVPQTPADAIDCLKVTGVIAVGGVAMTALVHSKQARLVDTVNKILRGQHHSHRDVIQFLMDNGYYDVSHMRSSQKNALLLLATGTIGPLLGCMISKSEAKEIVKDPIKALEQNPKFKDLASTEIGVDGALKLMQQRAGQNTSVPSTSTEESSSSSQGSVVE